MQDCPLPAPAEAAALPPLPPAVQCLEIARRAAMVDSPAALQAWWQAVAARWWPGARLVAWPLDASGPSGPGQWLQPESVAPALAAEDAAAWATRLHRAWLAGGCRPCRVEDVDADTHVGVGAGAYTEALVHGLRGRRLHAVLAPGALPGVGLAALELLAPWLELACSGAGLGPRPAGAAPTPRSPALWSGAWPAAASGPITVARAPGGALSLRERQIMAWVAQGKTNPEIGCILRISEFTVKNHLKSIFSKLDVTNRAQAVARLSRITPQA